MIQADNWPLSIEVALTYHGSVRNCHIQKMWTGGGILIPYRLFCQCPVLAGYRLEICDSE